MMVSSVCVVDREKADIDDGEFSVCCGATGLISKCNVRHYYIRRKLRKSRNITLHQNWHI